MCGYVSLLDKWLNYSSFLRVSFCLLYYFWVWIVTLELLSQVTKYASPETPLLHLVPVDLTYPCKVPLSVHGSELVTSLLHLLPVGLCDFRALSPGASLLPPLPIQCPWVCVSALSPVSVCCQIVCDIKLSQWESKPTMYYYQNRTVPPTQWNILTHTV